MRQVVRDTPEYQVTFTRCLTGELVFHINVYKWNARVYEKLLEEAWSLYYEYQGNMYATWLDEKQEKFMRMLNFNPTDLVAFDEHGNSHVLYKFGGKDGI